MMNKADIKKRLNKIYSEIPDFDCKHCHQCEGPIVWFLPEEILIRDFLKENNMKYKKWTKEQFQRNKKKCPYLKNDRCSIYPVRPIVCRLQGTIEELPCKHNHQVLIDNKKLKEIKNDMNKLVKEMNATGMIFSTKKYK